jgi:hypothetical protein
MLVQMIDGKFKVVVDTELMEFWTLGMFVTLLVNALV